MRGRMSNLYAGGRRRNRDRVRALLKFESQSSSSFWMPLMSRRSVSET